jgi:hypothetical protein
MIKFIRTDSNSVVLDAALVKAEKELAWFVDDRNIDIISVSHSITRLDNLGWIVTILLVYEEKE